MEVKKPEVKMIKLADIKVAKKNPRKHPLEQIEGLVSSIKEYGFNTPMVVDDKGNLLAGHARLEAAKKLKLKEAPAIVVHLSQKKAKEFMYADNKTYEAGVWDIDPGEIDILKGMPDGLKEMFSLDISFLENLQMDTSVTTGRGASMDDYLQNYDKQKYVKLILLVPRKKYLQIEKRAGEKKKTAREYALDVICKH